jgi:hypothetical protein
MSEQDPNQKHYFNPIASKDEQVNQLSKFQKDQIFTLWEEGKGEDNTEEFVLIKFNAEKMVFHLKQNAGLLNKLAGSGLKDKVALFRTSRGSKKYFSKGLFSYSETDSCYILAIEPPLFMAQQRSDYRLDVDPKLITVKLSWAGVEFQVNDISAGGLSLKVEAETSKLLSGRDFIEECKLIFKDQQFMIPSVQILKEWTEDVPESSLKMHFFGMRFRGMATKMEDRLAQMIAMEARGKEIRKILDDKKSKTK